MNFTDPQLRKCYESNLVTADGASSELCKVQALIAAHDLFRMLEGPHSSRVHETIWHLLLPKLRPSLRQWYQRSVADNGPVGDPLRDQLSLMAGEQPEGFVDICREPVWGA